MHGGFHLRRNHPNPPNRIRIRSATQRAWALDLEASSQREGISTKTGLAQSWKKWNPKCPTFLLKLEKTIWNNQNSELRCYHYSNIYQTPTGKLLQSVTWSARLAGLFSCSKHHTQVQFPSLHPLETTGTSTNLGTSLSSSFPPGHHQKSDIRRRPMPFQSHFWCVFFWMEQVPHLWSVRRMPQTVNPKPHPVQCNVYLAWLVNCSFKGLPSVCFTNRNSRFVALCKVPSRILCRKEMLGFYTTNLQSNKRLQKPPKWWFYMIYIVITWGWIQQKAVSTAQRQSHDSAIHRALAIVAPEEVREVTSKGSYLSDLLFLWKIEMREAKRDKYFKLM